MQKTKILGISVVIFLTAATGVFAQTSTPTEKVTPTLTATPTENAAEEVRDAVKEKARELIAKAKLGQKKAYVGEITKIDEDLLTLKTITGEKGAQVATDAAILITGKGKANLEAVKTGNMAIAMGYVGENEILDTRRLVVFTKSKTPVREVAFGKVTDISNETEKVLSVKNEKKNETYTIEITDSTTITKKIDEKVQKTTFSQIKKGDRVVAIGTVSVNEEKIITAKILHVIPGAVQEQAKETKPTPTGSSPTPTKKPTSTPSLSPTPTE